MSDNNENKPVNKDILEEKKELENDDKNNDKDNNKRRIALKQEDKVSKYKEKVKMNKKTKIILICISAFLLFVCIAFAIITCVNKLNTKVYKNVYMLGEDFSGKSSEEIVQVVSSKSNELNSNEKLDMDKKEILIHG